MNRLPHLAQRLFNTPLALHPDKAEIVMAALADRFGVVRLFRGDGSAASLDIVLEEEEPAPERPSAYDQVSGVAVIPVQGTLVAKLGTLAPFSGMTGYDGVRQNFLVALEDPRVEAIVLDIDSPGGEVAGCFDLADTIYKARGSKPIWAVLSESAYSAAYALAAAADRITVPRTGGVGSVGVIYLHADLSRALDKEGISVTLVTYGERKADLSEFLPLTKAAQARVQADVDTVGELFVETVARNRGLKASAVRETEAGTFLGAGGVEIGLADAVMAPDAAFRALLAELG
ncbi:MAG TPA: S49 family peptidase [Caulobacteraceae bacterium]|nr:S49 family peptidase [Caulobacteraceae bacterium]